MSATPLPKTWKNQNYAVTPHRSIHFKKCHKFKKCLHTFLLISKMHTTSNGKIWKMAKCITVLWVMPACGWNRKAKITYIFINIRDLFVEILVTFIINIEYKYKFRTVWQTNQWKGRCSGELWYNLLGIFHYYIISCKLNQFILSLTGKWTDNINF